MRFSFTDISIYCSFDPAGDDPHSHDQQLQRFISDFYHRKMEGYKPPHCTRVTIQPAFYNVWKGPGHFGSVYHVAVELIPDKYAILDDIGKKRYILDMIHTAMLQCAETYDWDRTVLDRAYRAVLDSGFHYRIDYPAKTARDKKHEARLSVEKTLALTTVYLYLQQNGHTEKIKMFEKKNSNSFDCVFELCKSSKWFDNDQFGISHQKGRLEIRYSIRENRVTYTESGTVIDKINFSKYFRFQFD